MGGKKHIVIHVDDDGTIHETIYIPTGTPGEYIAVGDNPEEIPPEERTLDLLGIKGREVQTEEEYAAWQAECDEYWKNHAGESQKIDNDKTAQDTDTLPF